MMLKFLKSLAVIAFFGCFTSTASAVSCPEGQQDYNGVCKYLRTTSTKPAPFIPIPIRNSQNVFLYPTAMPAKCATAQNDSDCMVAYSYIDTSLPPVISASFTNYAPVAGSTSTSPQWTSSNAVSMSISCSGVASSMAGAIALQGTPSGITFNSSVAGLERCVFTATNPFGTTSTATISVTFAAAPPPLPEPTISVTRTTGLPMKYPGTTNVVWSSTNATTVTIGCTSTNGGFTIATTSMGVSGSSGGATIASWVGKTSVCTWTATGAGGTAVYTETLTAVYTPPTISVSRTPLPFTAGQNYSITWSTTNATSVYLVCTTTGTGVAFSGPRNLSGTDTGVASAAWIGYPTRCIWTATGPGGTATAVDEFSTVATPPTPVYRFQGGGAYFWTSSPGEYQYLTTEGAYYWTYEGVAFNVYNTPSAVSGLLPVYRFWTDYGGRFYTQNEAEKDALISGYPSFHYEGVAWYALPSQLAGTVPVYRFFNPANSTHFFTASQGEKDWIAANIPSWPYEGISHYVWP